MIAIRKPILAGMALSLFLSFALIAAGEGKETKHRIAAAAVVGAHCNVKTDLHLDMDLVLTDVSKKREAISTTFSRQDEFAVEVVEAENGLPKAMKIDCKASVVESGGSRTGPAKQAKTSIDGKKFMARKTDGGYAVDGEGAEIKKEDLGFIESSQFFRRFLPAAEVKVGDQWKADPSGVFDILLGGAKGTLAGEVVCSLLKVEKERAEIQLLYKAKNKYKDAGASEAELNGLLVIDLAKGVPLSLKVVGTLKLSDTLKSVDGPDPTADIALVSAESKRLEFSITYE